MNQAYLFSSTSNFDIMISHLENEWFIVSSDSLTVFENGIRDFKDYISKNKLGIDFNVTSVWDFCWISLNAWYYTKLT